MKHYYSTVDYIASHSGKEVVMTKRDYIRTQIDALPDDTLDKVVEFIVFQRFTLGLFDSDTDYLLSVPGMSGIIRDGLNTPLSDCVPLSEVWADV